MVFQYFLN